jgi:hypothetical protein
MKIKLPHIPSSAEEYDKMASQPSHILLTITGLCPDVPNFRIVPTHIKFCWGDGIYKEYWPS